jgi:hypothetical protein
MTVWYETHASELPPEAAWELYHENSKTGRRTQFVAEDRAAPSPSPGLATPPAISLGPPVPLRGPSAATEPGTAESGGLTLAALSALLAFGGGADGDRHLVEVYFHVAGIEGLPGGLYRHDRAAAGARLVRRGDLFARIAAALVPPAALARGSIQMFIAGNLASGFALHGERGYRLSLMAAGARLRDLGLAAAALHLRDSRPAFHDREIDAILGLDGLTEGALAMVAVSAGTRQE